LYFTDQKLQTCYEQHYGGDECFSCDAREVRALIAAHDFFWLEEGPQSARVYETVWHLLSPRLRPGLRAWYQRHGAHNDPSARALREYLNRFAGENFENVAAGVIPGVT
jgi:hypothetical protein